MANSKTKQRRKNDKGEIKFTFGKDSFLFLAYQRDTDADMQYHNSEDTKNKRNPRSKWDEQIGLEYLFDHFNAKQLGSCKFKVAPFIYRKSTSSKILVWNTYQKDWQDPDVYALDPPRLFKVGCPKHNNDSTLLLSHKPKLPDATPQTFFSTDAHTLYSPKSEWSRTIGLRSIEAEFNSIYFNPNIPPVDVAFGTIWLTSATSENVMWRRFHAASNQWLTPTEYDAAVAAAKKAATAQKPTIRKVEDTAAVYRLWLPLSAAETARTKKKCLIFTCADYDLSDDYDEYTPFRTFRAEIAKYRAVCDGRAARVYDVKGDVCIATIDVNTRVVNFDVS